MKIAMNMLLWHSFISEEHFELFDKLKAAGYDGVELPVFEGDISHYEKLKQVITDAGLETLTVAGMPDDQHSLISDDAAINQNGFDFVKKAIDRTHALGGTNMCGPFYHTLGMFSGVGASDLELKRGSEAHHKLAQYAQDAGVHLTIESLNRFETYFLNTLEQAAHYVKLVDHPNFATMYDTFHANIEEKDPVAAFTDNIDIINHIHISENDRGTPGKGHIDFDKIFNAINASGYDKWLVIEAFGSSLPDLAAATCVWRQFYESKEELYTDGLKMIKSHL